MIEVRPSPDDDVWLEQAWVSKYAVLHTDKRIITKLATSYPDQDAFVAALERGMRKRGVPEDWPVVLYWPQPLAAFWEDAEWR